MQIVLGYKLVGVPVCFHAISANLTWSAFESCICHLLHALAHTVPNVHGDCSRANQTLYITQPNKHASPAPLSHHHHMPHAIACHHRMPDAETAHCIITASARGATAGCWTHDGSPSISSPSLRVLTTTRCATSTSAAWATCATPRPAPGWPEVDLGACVVVPKGHTRALGRWTAACAPWRS